MKFGKSKGKGDTGDWDGETRAQVSAGLDMARGRVRVLAKAVEIGSHEVSRVQALANVATLVHREYTPAEIGSLLLAALSLLADDMSPAYDIADRTAARRKRENRSDQLSGHRPCERRAQR